MTHLCTHKLCSNFTGTLVNDLIMTVIDHKRSSGSIFSLSSKCQLKLKENLSISQRHVDEFGVRIKGKKHLLDQSIYQKILQLCVYIHN